MDKPSFYHILSWLIRCLRYRLSELVTKCVPLSSDTSSETTPWSQNFSSKSHRNLDNPEFVNECGSLLHRHRVKAVYYIVTKKSDSILPRPPVHMFFVPSSANYHTMCTYMWLLDNTANSYGPVPLASLTYNWDVVYSNVTSLVVLNSVFRGKWNTPTAHNGVSGNIWPASPPCDDLHCSTKLLPKAVSTEWELELESFLSYEEKFSTSDNTVVSMFVGNMSVKNLRDASPRQGYG